MVSEVNGEPVEAVCDRRAGGAAGAVVGAEHEVVDEHLRAPSEQVRKRFVALIRLEAVLLVDADPGELLAPPRELVAAPG